MMFIFTGGITDGFALAQMFQLLMFCEASRNPPARMLLKIPY
jgi:hypothetical protein